MSPFAFRTAMARWLLSFALLAATGCAQHTSPAPAASPTRPIPLPLPSSRPAAAGTDDTAPDAVSAAALTAMWSIDTATDHDPRAAALRASPWLSPAYLAALRSDPSPGTDATWTTWAAHRARTQVNLAPGHDQRPADTATTAYRQWSLTITPVGRDGWRGPPSDLTAFATLTREHHGATWKVAAITVS
ncbi:hypothetical protein [Nonomuraea typhae]|uniref:hypothetical protein n=1 Tax=Nonomuraea typhae TaxID=2603600 RepID=UPI0012F8277A|nr:hypothetical protein [Nonomuraea typhae]